uniref:Uncharacterized protein n=1 Tax=Kalanchoe fedtschenkoi TaxID=63787 RepID=A0A7N0SYI1_KALFE
MKQLRWSEINLILRNFAQKSETIKYTAPYLPRCVYRIRRISTPSSSHLFSQVISLFNDKDSDLNSVDAEKRKIMIRKVEALRNEVVKCGDSYADVARVLEDKGVELLSGYPDGSAGIELLNQLSSQPVLALEVFRWRKANGAAIRMTPEECAKAIKIAVSTNVSHYSRSSSVIRIAAPLL